MQKLTGRFQKAHLRKVKDGIYMDTGNHMDLTHFFGIIAWLKQMEWFHQYAVQMDWYHDRLGTRFVLEPEDMLKDLSLWDTV